MKLKKVFVLFLTLCMALSVMPFAVWAEEETDGNMPGPEIEEPTPVPEEPTPVPEEPTPVPEEPTPVPEEPAPVPEEPTPVPEEPTPAPEEPTPAPEEPTPAPAEPTSAPAEPEYIPPKVLANGREYISLSEALADIGDGEFEIVLIDDLSENAEVGKNQSITLILADCSFSGEIINYGKLTVFGSESGFDGCIITRAYCEKDEDGNVVDEASGETVIEDGSFNGELILEQKSDARVSADAQPKLRLNSGRFGVDLTKRYLNWDEESSEPEYSASAGSIVITGGVFFADPSEYVAEGYTAIANDGWWAVGVKTEEGALPTEGEGNSPAPGAEIYIDTIDTNEAEETSGENPETKLPEEKKPVRQEPELVIIDVDVNITGDGSVVFEGEEFGKGSKLKFVAYSEPVLEIRPAENWKISNVTVGTNGSAIPFGAADKIQLPPLVNYATVNVTFAAIHADEINKAEDNAESIPSGDLPAEKNPDEETGEHTQKTEEKPVNQVEIAVNITGEGSVLFDGKEYKNKDSLSLPEYSSPEFTIQPAENWKIYNVTVGANGSATPHGTESRITIDSLSYFTTLNIIFAEMKPEEIEAQKEETDKQEEHKEKTEGEGTPAEKQMLTTSKSIASQKSPLLLNSGEESYEISIYYAGNGQVFYNDSLVAYSGSSFTIKTEETAELVFKPASEYYVYNCTVNNVRKGSIDSYRLENINERTIVSVHFAPIIGFDVKFDSGFEEGSSTITKQGGEKINAPSAPNRRGYRFLGWKSNGESPVILQENDEYTVTENITFKAQWEAIEYKIEFVPNGGTVEVKNPDSYTVVKGYSAFPTPIKPDHIFYGWFDNEQFEGTASTFWGPGEIGDITFYARWNANLSFEKSGNGDGDIICNDIAKSAGTVAIKAGEKQAIKIKADDDSIIVDVQQDGKTVEGFAKGKEYSFEIIPAEDTTISVVFQGKSELTIKYDPARGVIKNGETTYENGAKILIPADGNISLMAEPELGYYLKKAELIVASKTEPEELTPPFVIDNPGEDAVFDAEFDIYTDITVTYDPQNNSELIPVPATAGKLFTIDNAPRKAGYVFKGWLNSEDGKLYSNRESFTPTGDVTLTAQWLEQYTINYVTNGGTLDFSVKKTYTSEDPAFALPSDYQITKGSATFDGWYTSPNFSSETRVASIDPSKTSGNITLYAKWIEKYKVSVYHTNNGVVFYNGQPLPSGSSFELEEGKTAELKFAATTSGYYVYNCTVNNVRRGSVDGLTVGPIKENMIISVTFAPTFVRPITGDANPLMLWACLMAASALGMAGTALLRKKRKAEKH